VIGYYVEKSLKKGGELRMAHAVAIKTVSASEIENLRKSLGLESRDEVRQLALKLLKLVVDTSKRGAVPMFLRYTDDPAPERIYLVNGH